MPQKTKPAQGFESSPGFQTAPYSQSWALTSGRRAHPASGCPRARALHPQAAALGLPWGCSSPQPVAARWLFPLPRSQLCSGPPLRPVTPCTASPGTWPFFIHSCFWEQACQLTSVTSLDCSRHHPIASDTALISPLSEGLALTWSVSCSPAGPLGVSVQRFCHLSPVHLAQALAQTGGVWG